MSKSKSGHDLTPLVRSDREWRDELTDMQFHVTRESGTEAAFTGELCDNHEDGVYVSVCGGLPLFASDAKFDSGSGWPSFVQPIDPEHVIERVDATHGMARTELVCARSGAHLGHVFDDGPAPTGRRYCINSAALRFVPKGKGDESSTKSL